MNRTEVFGSLCKQALPPLVAGALRLLLAPTLFVLVFPFCAAAAQLSEQHVQSRLESTLRVKAIKLASTTPFRKWNAALSRHRTASRDDGSAGHTAWRHTIRQLRLLPEDERPAAVNARFNRIPYRDDSRLWQQSDYWAAPSEMLSRNAGDCEDYALAKYFALREAGTEAQKLLILVVRDAVNGNTHAVLLVAGQSGVVVLDNLKGAPIPLAYYTSIVKPVYAINELGAWFLTGDPDRESVARQPTASGASN